MRSPQDAIKEAERCWFYPDRALPGPDGKRFEKVSKNILEDPKRIDPEMFFVERVKAGIQEAARQVEANQEVVEHTIQGLGKVQQVQFREVAAQLKANPRAMLALQIMLLKGTLLQGPQNIEGQGLLPTLAGLTRIPMHQAIGRSQLLADLVQEIVVPQGIRQWFHGTCTVTALQTKMAIENPAEYVRIVGGLASLDGKVRIANGDSLVRQPGSEQPHRIANGMLRKDGTADTYMDPRTASARLWQAALMQYGFGTSTKYDAVTDTDIGPLNRGVPTVTREIAGLSGVSPENIYPGVVFHGVAIGGIRLGYIEDKFAELITKLQQQARPEHPVAVGLLEGGKQGAGHVVLVTKVDNTRVYFNNSNSGAEESLSVEEFKKWVELGVGYFGDFGHLPSSSR